MPYSSSKTARNNPKQHFTINYTRSRLNPNRGRVCEHHPRFRTNRGKRKTLPRLQRGRKLLNPGPYFSAINLLLIQGSGYSPKQRKRNYFIPERLGKVPCRGKSGGERRTSTRGDGGREERPLPRRPAEPSPRAGPGTAPRLRHRRRRGDPSRRPGDRPGPRAGAEASRRPRFLPPPPLPGLSSLLSHRRSPPREGDGAARGGRREPPARPRAAAGDRRSAAGARGGGGERARGPSRPRPRCRLLPFRSPQPGMPPKGRGGGPPARGPRRRPVPRPPHPEGRRGGEGRPPPPARRPFPARL